jgi:hypothetical protein
MASVSSDEVAQASTTMNIIQQAAGSIGTAVMSVILTNQILGDPSAATFSGVLQGQVPADQVPAPVLEAGRAALAGAFGHTFTVASILIVFCLVPAFFLPRKGVQASANDGAPILTPSH